MRTNLFQFITPALVCAAAIVTPAQILAKELTAFEVVKEANKYVGEDVKDRVVEIRAEKSLGGLAPNVWFIVYYDADATFKATEVKMGGGKKLSVKRPGRILEPITGEQKELEKSKLKTDSDKAIETAVKDPLLEKVKLTNTELKLEHGDAGPQWKVWLWAEKLRDSGKTVQIGYIIVLAEDGKVIDRALHIDRLD